MPKTRPVTTENFCEVAGISPEPEPAKISASAVNGNGQFDLQEFFARHGITIKSTSTYNGGTKYDLEECPFDPTHRGKDAAIIQGANGAIVFKCFHNSCSNRKWQDVRQKFDPGCYDRRFQTRDANGRARGTADEARKVEPVEYRLLTCAELDSGDFDLEYLIEDVLVAKQPGMVGGPMKGMKTSLVCALILALATGLRFLGRFVVNRAVPVVIMSGESGLATLQGTARSIALAMGIALKDVENIWWSCDIPQIGAPNHMAALRKMLERTKAEVLIVDPTYMAMPNLEPGNLFAQGELLRSIQEVCQDLGVCLLLVHHTKRSITDPYAPPELADLAWAGFGENCRQWILLSRREKYEPPDIHRLWLNVGGSAGHSSLWALNIEHGQYRKGQVRPWKVELISAEEARVDAKQRAAEGKEELRAAKTKSDVSVCKDALRSAIISLRGQGVRSQLQDRSGHKGKAFDLALAELLRTGEWIDAKIKRANGQEYDGFAMKVIAMDLTENNPEAVSLGHSADSLGESAD